jgi:hypothetical protein
VYFEPSSRQTLRADGLITEYVTEFHLATIVGALPGAITSV